MKTLLDALIIRQIGDRVEESVDQVVTETTCTMHVNGRKLVSLMCTPLELDALAAGFLIAEGLLESRDSLISLTVDENGADVFASLQELPADWESRFHTKTLTSGCGRGVTFTDTASLRAAAASRAAIRLRPETIRALLKEFKAKADLYARTGGVHSAALADAAGGLLLFSEDIGRHNAIDKVIGKAFLADIALDDKIIITSGRVSAEIMTKAIRSRIPVVLSRAAPTCMSITAAEDHGVTLIGFARGRRMNIYTHPGRVEMG